MNPKLCWLCLMDKSVLTIICQKRERKSKIEMHSNLLYSSHTENIIQTFFVFLQGDINPGKQYI